MASLERLLLEGLLNHRGDYQQRDYRPKQKMGGISYKTVMKVKKLIEEEAKSNKKEDKKSKLSTLELAVCIALGMYIFGPFILWMQNIAMHNAISVH